MRMADWGGSPGSQRGLRVTFLSGHDSPRSRLSKAVSPYAARAYSRIRMGVTQATISRMEQPHDLLLSTLNSYLQAIGGTARMIVSFADGRETTLDLSQLA